MSVTDKASVDPSDTKDNTGTSSAPVEATTGTTQDDVTLTDGGKVLWETLHGLKYIQARFHALDQKLHPLTEDNGVNNDLVFWEAHANAVSAAVRLVSRKGKTCILVDSRVFPDHYDADAISRMITDAVQEQELASAASLAKDLVKDWGRTTWLPDEASGFAQRLSRKLLSRWEESKGLQAESLRPYNQWLTQLYDSISKDASPAPMWMPGHRAARRDWDAEAGTEEPIEVTKLAVPNSRNLQYLKSVLQTHNSKLESLIEGINISMGDMNRHDTPQSRERQRWSAVKDDFLREWPKSIEAPDIKNQALIKHLNKAAADTTADIEASLFDFLSERRTSFLGHKDPPVAFTVSPFVTDKVHSFATLPNETGNQVYAFRPNIGYAAYRGPAQTDFAQSLQRHISLQAERFGVQLGPSITEGGQTSGQAA